MTATVIATCFTKGLLVSPELISDRLRAFGFGTPGVVVLPGIPGVGERETVVTSFVVPLLTSDLAVDIDETFEDVDEDNRGVVVDD